MTPPNTPPENYDVPESLSPKRNASPKRQSPVNNPTSEMICIVDSLHPKAGDISTREAVNEFSATKRFPPGDVQVNRNENLTINQVTDSKQSEICLTDLSILVSPKQNVFVPHKETPDSLGETLRSPEVRPEVMHSEVSNYSLLDNILFDNGKNQAASQENNSPAPLTFAVLDGQQGEIVNLSGSNLCPNVSSQGVIDTTSNTFVMLNEKEEIIYENHQTTLPSNPQPFPEESTSASDTSINQNTSTIQTGPVHHVIQQNDLLGDMSPSLTVPRLITGATSIVLDTFIDHITNTYNHYDAHGSDFFQKIHRLFFEYLVGLYVKLIPSLILNYPHQRLC